MARNLDDRFGQRKSSACVDWKRVRQDSYACLSPDPEQETKSAKDHRLSRLRPQKTSRNRPISKSLREKLRLPFQGARLKPPCGKSPVCPTLQILAENAAMDLTEIIFWLFARLRP